MPFSWLVPVLIALAFLSGRPQADIKVRIRTVVDGRVEYETIYAKDEHRRTDFSNHRRVARILDCDARKAFAVDLDRGEYSELDWPWFPRSRSELEQAAKKQRKNAAVKATSEPAANRQMIDTGERKEIFGRTARRMVTTQEHPAWTGSPSQPRTEVVEDVTEAWHIHLPIGGSCEPPYLLEGVVGLTSGGMQLRLSDFAVKLISTRRYKIFGADGTVRELTTRFEREVVELSEETLDPTLFEVPQRFRKVRRVEFPQ